VFDKHGIERGGRAAAILMFWFTRGFKKEQISTLQPKCAEVVQLCKELLILICRFCAGLAFG
jgi:hypothetical protein